MDLSLIAFDELPFTNKQELAEDQVHNPPYGTVRIAKPDRYTRMHQTSGTTTGRPLCWWDTEESWNWMLGMWRSSFPLMGLSPQDRACFTFSFGPFIGFWTGFEAAACFGMSCLTTGGMSSTARLRFLLDHQATVVFATPSYALHLAEVATQEGINLEKSSVRALVLAGEPGAGISTTRDQLEHQWGARVLDHYGMTEVGPVAFEPWDSPGNMLFFESEHIIEILDPVSHQPCLPGEIGELIVTPLGRTGSPLIRFRTGDLVRLHEHPPKIQGSLSQRMITGGVLGRIDDMIHVRGNNLYPGTIETIVRQFPEIAEFRIVIDHSGPLVDLRLQIEPKQGSARDLSERVGQAIRDKLLFRVDVELVPVKSLPRFEMKARRIVHMPSREQLTASTPLCEKTPCS